MIDLGRARNETYENSKVFLVNPDEEISTHDSIVYRSSNKLKNSFEFYYESLTDVVTG